MVRRYQVTLAVGFGARAASMLVVVQRRPPHRKSQAIGTIKASRDKY